MQHSISSCCHTKNHISIFLKNTLIGITKKQNFSLKDKKVSYASQWNPPHISKTPTLIIQSHIIPCTNQLNIITCNKFIESLQSPHTNNFTQHLQSQILPHVKMMMMFNVHSISTSSCYLTFLYHWPFCKQTKVEQFCLSFYIFTKCYKVRYYLAIHYIILLFWSTTHGILKWIVQTINKFWKVARSAYCTFLVGAPWPQILCFILKHLLIVIKV